MDVRHAAETELVLPAMATIDVARSKLAPTLLDDGLGFQNTQYHLLQDIIPGLNAASKSSNYYGFVTGGSTPAASFADNLVTKHDQNVCIHLPHETIATDVEDRALDMLCELLDFSPEAWSHRTFTTGATASNVLGLACGREYVISEAARKLGREASVAQDGLSGAMREVGLEGVQILTTVPHSSLRKAAAVVGLGRSSVEDVGFRQEQHRFDLERLGSALARPNVASIVAVSCAEVNTGFFATSGEEMAKLRTMCDRYGAWLHIDAAFGAMARLLPDKGEYSTLRAGVAGMELADSVTGDAHKLLNVPYDTGFFLSKHLPLGTHVFQNTNAAYLNEITLKATGLHSTAIPSPLNIGIENSRRFRALPVYATLAAYGRVGYRDMLERQVRLARGIARLLLDSTDFVLLPNASVDVSVEESLSSIYIIVLFRAKNEALNVELVQHINASRKVYVSGTQWEGRPAARFAVANWQVDVQSDLALIKEVLSQVVIDWSNHQP